MGFAFHHHGHDAQAGQFLGDQPPGVAFLDAAGERGFAAHGDAPGVGRGGAGEQARGHHQLVGLAERVAGGVHFLAQEAGSEGPPSQTGVGRGHLLPAVSLVGHI